MNYIIDIHAVPPHVVVVTASDDEAQTVGQRYADQVRRDLVWAKGPRADEPSIRPTIAQAPAPLTLEAVPSPEEAAEQHAAAVVGGLTLLQRKAVVRFLLQNHNDPYPRPTVDDLR